MKLIFINPQDYIVVAETEVKDNETCWIYNLTTKILIQTTGKKCLVANDRKVVGSNYLKHESITILATTPEEIVKMAKEQEVEQKANDYIKQFFYNSKWAAFVNGYIKSKTETPFSEEDMMDFAKWSSNCSFVVNENKWHCPATDLYSSDGRPIVKTTAEMLALYKQHNQKLPKDLEVGIDGNKLILA